MITKKIFLASSSELEGDRREFEIFVGRKNKEWISRGIYLDLVVWEYFLGAIAQTRLQDEYNKVIAESDLVVFLFWRRVGEYTNEEFEIALGRFRTKNKPLIYTYFKTADVSSGGKDEDGPASLQAFKDKLVSIGHFYAVYKTADELNLKFNQQLEMLASNGFFAVANPPGGQSIQPPSLKRSGLTSGGFIGFREAGHIQVENKYAGSLLPVHTHPSAKMALLTFLILILLCGAIGVFWFLYHLTKDYSYNKSDVSIAPQNKSEKTEAVVEVIAVNCSPTRLPDTVPSNGINVINFTYSPDAGGGGPIGFGNIPPGSKTAWPLERIAMPMYCEFTTHGNGELYDVYFNMHVSFHAANKTSDGQIANGRLIGEREWPAAIGRINSNYSFGFYAFSTSDYMVYVTFPSTATSIDGISNQRKAVRLLPINWAALSFPPASSLSPPAGR
jgi:hypothetical protein